MVSAAYQAREGVATEGERAPVSRPPAASLTRRALDDIQASINELKFYREHIFQPVEPVEEASATAAVSSEPAQPRKTAL